jgi:hypothetical protein
MTTSARSFSTGHQISNPIAIAFALAHARRRTTRAIGATDLTLVLAAALAGSLLAGCGPSFDPASLIETARVVGARVEVDGAPDRASPKPGETAQVTWLVTAPEALPPIAWAYALCVPGTVDGKVGLGCEGGPLAVFQGTSAPPRISFAVPSAEALGAATSLILYGQICAGAGSTPTFDPQDGIPRCNGAGAGTTASVSIGLELGADVNHNPTADRAFTFDGQPWAPVGAASDPCVVGPRVAAGTKDHLIGNTTVGSDREPFTALVGNPPAPKATRESLQISHFTTAGKLQSQFAFVEAADPAAETAVSVKWEAPKAAEVPAAGLPVTFTFVVRDDRGGTDWTTRAACVVH